MQQFSQISYPPFLIIFILSIEFHDKKRSTRFSIACATVHASFGVIMSKAKTVISLVLGVLLFLVFIAKHYNNIFCLFKQYKRFSKELKKF
jgi:hypothetical protein